MKDFNVDIFEVNEELVPTSQVSAQVSTHELEALVGSIVAKKVKRLKKKHKKREEELKMELKKLRKKAKNRKNKKGKKSSKKKKDSLDGLFMKAANVSIESGLPELFKSMSARSQRNSKSGKGGGRDD